MAPMLLDSLDTPSYDFSPIKSIPICSDPSVVPSEAASKSTKELWWLHGHPHSKRYSDPKLVTLSALLRHDGAVYKGQKGFLYPRTAKPSTPYDSMTWDEFDRATESIALLYAQNLRMELEDANVSRKQPTIALLGGGKTLEYFCTELALQKLGVRVLLLAESNAPEALHHLLKTCHALAVITDSKNSFTGTNGVRKLDMIEALPEAHDVKAFEKVEALKFQDFGDLWERHSFIIHSSGSTGIPKPIIHTNRSMMLIARMYRLFQEFDVKNWFLLFPLYHIAGISIALSNLPNGQILSFPPLSWPPSSSSIFSAWKTLSGMGHPVDCVHCAPTLIENMFEYISENGGDFSPLVSLKLLQPGGAALSESIVSALTSKGVNVKTTYGSTEIGPPFRSIPHTRDNPKCYTFRNLYPDNSNLKMEEVGEGLYECVVYKGFELAAELWEGKSENEPYRTNDLFIQDPPGSGFFILQGRKDDILVHTNGENTTAGPLQLDIQTASKLINKAVALGHSRPNVGLLVELHEEYDRQDSFVQERVWNAVQEVNARYPTHSRILRSMIYILPEGETLPVTPKGNVKRKEVERIYASEIADMYSDPVCTNGNSILSPTGPSAQPLSEYLRALFSSLSNTPASEIKDWTTLYDLGIDSRIAISLRSSLSSHLSRPVSLSAIFEHPSISSLSTYLSPQSSNASPSAPTKPFSHETIARILSRLQTEIKSWPAREEKTWPEAEKHTVLLTGASGSLGTALLEVLSASPAVEKIYAMIRGPNNIQKLRDSLEKRGMSTAILEGSKIEILNFSMRDSLLGVDIETYYKLAKTVTVVIGNAWKMDFNLGVKEFEGDCIRNTISLLRLTQTGRPKILAFTSSISTCMGTGPQAVSEEPIGDDPSVALSTGYAQSKYIIERLLQSSPSPTLLLRVGQLCGHTRTSHWNPDEMWPILFSSSLHPSINAFPLLNHKAVDWIPVDIAAGTIADLLLQSNKEHGREEKAYEVFNIVNPKRVSWEEVLKMVGDAAIGPLAPTSLGAELDSNVSTPRLPYPSTTTLSAWTSLLNNAAQNGISPTELPGLRLLAVFEEMAAASEQGEEPENEKIFETAKTEKISDCMRDCEAVNKGWIEGNVMVWRKMGFMK